MAGKKKILFIAEALGGGIFTYMEALANELIKSFDICIAYGIRKETPDDYRSCFDKRIQLIRVNNFARNISPVKDLRAYFEMKQIAHEVKPDIIHLHSSKAGILGRIAFEHFKKNGKPVTLYYTPHGYSFLMKDKSTGKRMFYRMLEFLCGKGRGTTISCSPGEHRESLRLARNAVYVNNGINTDHLKKELSGLSGQIREDTKGHCFTIFTLGRICAQKNPALFNRIAESLPDIRFLWIGDGEERGMLKASNVEITGWMDRRYALREALKADVFILTSLWEGLPMSLLEAMYMKKPCIVSDVPGNRDVIINGVNGLVCSTRQEFADAIVRLKTKCNVSQITESAYRDVLRIYNTRNMAACYSRIYRGDIINNGEEYDKEHIRSGTAD